MPLDPLTYLEDARKVLEGRFRTQWGATTPVQYENLKLPAGLPDGSWVWFVTIFGGEHQKVLSQRSYRVVGIVKVTVESREGTGTLQPHTLAIKAANIFRGQDLTVGADGKIEFLRGPLDVDKVGVRDGWFGVSVSVPFIFDYVLT